MSAPEKPKSKEGFGQTEDGTFYQVIGVNEDGSERRMMFPKPNADGTFSPFPSAALLSGASGNRLEKPPRHPGPKK